MQTNARHAWLWLFLGAVLLCLAHFRLGLGVLAWIAPVPILHYLRLSDRTRARWLALAVMLLAWSVATAKILTAPMPLVLALAFGLPIGTMLGLPYLVWAWLRPRVGELRATFGFATGMVLGEYALHALSPFGTWGSAASTQLDQLALLQLASVTGQHGVSFLIYFVAGTLERSLADRSHVRPALAAIAIVFGVVTAGQLRLALANDHSATVARVATIDSDARFGGLPLPERNALDAIDRTLFERTHQAAQAGARFVVWPEAATLVEHAEEPTFLARVGALARAEHIRLVAAYVVPLTRAPLLYENKYAMIAPSGQVEHVYDKHHPVPGEPSVRGLGPLPIAHDATFGRVSGAICYDYDFPRLGLEHAALGVDLVALPASDWRGIDPIHAQMVVLRAIEGGHSVVRATRMGASIVIDPLGRTVASHSDFDAGANTLIADIPVRGVSTIYGFVGDTFVALCALYLLGIVVWLASKQARIWYARAPSQAPYSPSPPAQSSPRASDSV